MKWKAITLLQKAESIELNIEDQAFLGASPTSSPLLISKMSHFLSRPCVSPVKITAGRGGRGSGWSQIIQPRESLVYYKIIQYSLAESDEDGKNNYFVDTFFVVVTVSSLHRIFRLGKKMTCFHFLPPDGGVCCLLNPCLKRAPPVW